MIFFVLNYYPLGGLKFRVATTYLYGRLQDMQTQNLDPTKRVEAKIYKRSIIYYKLHKLNTRTRL